MSDHEYDATGLDPVHVLTALYDAAQPVGLGRMHYSGAPMTEQDAREALASVARPARGDAGGVSYRFDYVNGRPLKVWIDVSADGSVTVSGLALYDRDQGEGKARAVLDALRGGR